MGSNTINCPNCGSPNYQGATVCQHCHAKMPPYGIVAQNSDEDILQRMHIIKPYAGILPRRK
jgi:uncharacterized Zn finger protein (UPF0148 family)